jgi:hypothetical protein
MRPRVCPGQMTLCVVQIDDHMVHRGHAVFDTCTLANGCVCSRAFCSRVSACKPLQLCTDTCKPSGPSRLYRLNTHLDRLLASAAGAKISLPFPRERIQHAILRCLVASLLIDVFPSSGACMRPHAHALVRATFQHGSGIGVARWFCALLALSRSLFRGK